MMCHSLGLALRTALASLYVPDMDWYLIGDLSVKRMLLS
jgi:hypothetical protein